MSIPLAMSPVGYDTWVTELRRALITYLGTLHLEVDYLPDEKKLVVHTDRVSDETYAEVAEIAAEYMPSGVTLEQYNHHWEISWRDINKYAGFKTMAALKAAYPSYKNDLTSDGGWIWPLTNLVSNSQKLGQHDYGFAWLPAKYAIFYLPNLETLTGNWMNGSKANEADVYAPKLKSSNRIVADSDGNIRKIKGYFPLLQRAPYAFHANKNLRELEATFPSLSEGTYFLNNSQINKESALRVLNSIPAYTSGNHPLTIGIHIDHKYDPEVNTVLKRAGGAPGTTNEYFPPDGVIIDPIADDEYKGWKLTVQWNGKATENAYPAPTTT